MYENKPIRTWAEEDRPREKLASRGVQSLTDTELLTILIGHGTRRHSAMDIARLLIEQFGGIRGLARASLPELSSLPGIGMVKAVTLAAVFELLRRKQAAAPERKQIRSSADAFALFYPSLADLDREEMVILLLDRNNRVQHQFTAGKGGVNATLVDPRIVLREAVSRLSSGIIMGHNHPSGNIKPSQADIDLTKKIQEGARLMDLALLDHLILGNETYFSFADSGML